MRKIFLFVILFCLIVPENLHALSNSSDAFMSLPFGHSFTRTKKRMENSGAKTLTPRELTLSMEGYFEGFPARFLFGFHKKKGLKSKALYIQSSGDKIKDNNLYINLQKAHNSIYGTGNESPVMNTRKAGKIMLRNIWTPDRYTTITLTYNPEATIKFPGTSMNDRPVHLIYKYEKWDN